MYALQLLPLKGCFCILLIMSFNEERFFLTLMKFSLLVFLLMLFVAYPRNHCQN